MRTCLSFLVVEMMRAGKSPQEACVIGIQRMFELETCYSEGEAPPASDAMHSHLVVGVVAMDALGNVHSLASCSSTCRIDGIMTYLLQCVYRWEQHLHLVRVALIEELHTSRYRSLD